MEHQNAFERIAELEAKLVIATENAVQAVKERDKAMHVAGVACQDLAETETELEQVTKERDLAIADRQDSDQVAEEIAMRAGRVLQELKKWREITIYPWCLDRLDGIIAMMDWTQSEEKQ